MSDGIRAVLITFAMAFQLFGFGLSICAILSSSWQMVDLEEHNSEHEHGLWLDCMRPKYRNITSTQRTNCVYKFDFEKYYGHFDPEYLATAEVGRHRFFAWHKIVLVLLGLSLITAILAILVGALNLLVWCVSLCCLRRLCTLCLVSCSLVFAFVIFLTMFLSCAGEVVFLIYSQQPENRFIKGVARQQSYEQQLGVAFYVQLAACFMNLLALCVSLAVPIRRFWHQYKYRRSTSWTFTYPVQ